MGFGDVSAGEDDNTSEDEEEEEMDDIEDEENEDDNDEEEEINEGILIHVNNFITIRHGFNFKI